MARGKAKAGKRSRIGSILVVEDDAVLALSIETALLDAGADSVTICPTTNEALEALRSDKPDAVVLDVHLSDRDDGWAIAELLRDIGPRPPRIVFSTGSPDDIPEDIAKLGPVLQKPYSDEELIAAVSAPERGGLLSRLARPAR